MPRDKTKKCSDCLHFEACELNSAMRIHLSTIAQKNAYYCKAFKDKSRFVELPCKVGDIVYCFAPCFDTDHNPKLKVVEKEIVELKTIATVFGLNFDIDSIGKTIFLTREEAEKALAEREEK